MHNKHKHRQNLVLHDIFDIRGGGERLALSLTHAMQADLGFGKHSNNSFDLAKAYSQVHYDLGLEVEFAGLKTWALSRLFKNQTQFLHKYQKVIYSGMVCPLAIINHMDKENYYYCHTPPRFVYDKYDYYMQLNHFPQKILLKVLVAWFRPQYEESVALMDVVIANSKFVQARIKKHLNRDSVIVYPPCNIAHFNYQPPQDYYLSVGRFDKLKRIDKIIQAFKQMPNKKLLICSSGSEDKILRKLAGNTANITFTGQVSDEKLSQLIEQSIATIYIPKDEDFGMSPVESMAAGKPVICSGHGGLTESVINGETGCYINEEDLQQSLINCVTKLDRNQAIKMKSACENRAIKFSEENFHKNMQKFVLD